MLPCAILQSVGSPDWVAPKTYLLCFKQLSEEIKQQQSKQLARTQLWHHCSSLEQWTSGTAGSSSAQPPSPSFPPT